MIHTILTSTLLIITHSQLSSFNNLPDSSLTSYQGTISCNSRISSVFLPHTNYQYHTYKLSEFNGIGCTIFANLTATNSNINSAISSLSILIYTSSGKLYNTTSFTNKHDSTHYIVFHNSNSNSHYATLYEYTLQCTKKCHRKIPKKIRRMQSGTETETDDDYDDINDNGVPIGVESGDDDETEQSEESQSNEEPQEFIDDSSEGAEIVTDMDIITTTTSVTQIEATTSTGNENENQRDRNVDIDGEHIGDNNNNILNNGKNENAEIRTYYIMIDFSKTS
eukprot:332213_1